METSLARLQTDIGPFLSFLRTGLYASLLIFICAHLNGGIQDIKLKMEKNDGERSGNLIVLPNYTPTNPTCFIANYSSDPEMSIHLCNEQIEYPSYNISFYVNNILQVTYNKCEASLLTKWIRECVIPPTFPVACGLQQLYGLHCTFPPSPIRDTRLCYKNNGQYDHFAINDGARLTASELAHLVKVISKR